MNKHHKPDDSAQVSKAAREEYEDNQLRETPVEVLRPSEEKVPVRRERDPEQQAENDGHAANERRRAGGRRLALDSVGRNTLRFSYWASRHAAFLCRSTTLPVPHPGQTHNARAAAVAPSLPADEASATKDPACYWP